MFADLSAEIIEIVGIADIVFAVAIWEKCDIVTILVKGRDLTTVVMEPSAAWFEMVCNVNGVVF
jgi:hypothetical protein